MHIYEYVCTNNNHVFEELQKINDPPIDKCKICAGPVTKVVSKSSFHLKGSGWYLTDYKNKNSTPLNSIPMPNTAKPAETADPPKKEIVPPAAKTDSKTS